MSNPAFSVQSLIYRQCIELAVEPGSHSLSGELQSAPAGAVVQEPFATWGFHYAPRRWVFLDPQENILEGARSGGAITFDVHDKWCILKLQGRQVARVLASGCNEPAVLKDHRCAILPLFDCPIILTRHEIDFIILVDSSYEWSLRHALTGAGERVGRPGTGGS